MMQDSRHARMPRAKLLALFRRMVEDYEARLAPPSAMAQPHHARGKAKQERFEDGEVQFEAIRSPRWAAGTGSRSCLAGVVLLFGSFRPD
jgi:hypothetical protein